MRSPLRGTALALSCATVWGALLVAGGCGRSDEVKDTTHHGTLDASDATLPEDDSPYDDFVVPLQPGWIVVATMQSEDFEPYLLLMDQDGQTVAQTNAPDESGARVRLAFTARKMGLHRLFANTRRPDGRGDYTLRIQVTPPEATVAQ